MNQYLAKYHEEIQRIQKNVMEQEIGKIEEVGGLFAKTVQEGGAIFVFGASHAGIIAEEMFYRTGGLAVINPLFSPTLMLNTRPATLTSQMERLLGFGATLLDTSPAKKGDVLLLHSVSGRNAVSIDMAIRAKELGMHVVAITNLTYSKQVTSRHPSGKNLYQLADIVIDNHGDFEDSSVKLDNIAQGIGPTSSVVGCMIANLIVIATAAGLVELGMAPPIFHSANVDGGDSYNAKLFEQYKDRIHYM
ncbi:MAG: SIS domain-containing protein [Defluviitaleaceae bacterium]|nr:SIS domain-containing protein [Defluviitaleaceae bacterium]